MMAVGRGGRELFPLAFAFSKAALV
jgi:hypothetical protein